MIALCTLRRNSSPVAPPFKKGAIGATLVTAAICFALNLSVWFTAARSP